MDGSFKDEFKPGFKKKIKISKMMGMARETMTKLFPC